MSRTPIAANPIPSSYRFDGITNTSEANHAEYVRITTYGSKDASGPIIDNGSVAFAVLGNLTVGAYVPPFLRLCVGVTVAPDCSTMNGNSIKLGELTSKQANIATSQFSTGTNDPNGYVINVLGTTMTSGNNVIPALTSPSIGIAGESQFGINLRANTSPQVGKDPLGAGTGFPTANYNAPNLFMFNSGDAITNSNFSTDYNRMTVSYLININVNQPVGVYSSTFTYVATVQF
jgi:hypothetical protein